MAERLPRKSEEKRATVLPIDSAVPLESILCTEELMRRPSRPPDYATENRALTALVQALADSPRTIFQTLADTILKVFKTGSAGISLLSNDGKSFSWAAIAGAWQPHLGGGTPRDFGPCGDVLDHNRPLLFKHWERRYPYLLEAAPLAEEGLLVPFYSAGRAVGTVWAIAHDERKFDAEDLRQLENLGRFASAANQAAASMDSRDQRRAALNLMEDAVEARGTLEAANLELRESEERNRELLKALPVAVYTTDAKGTITGFNEAAEAFAGRHAQVGKDRWCICHRVYRADGSPFPQEEWPIAVMLRTGQLQHGVEAIAERPDGTRAWFMPYPTLVRDASGAIVGGINVLVDITERKLAEAALIKSEKLAAAGRLAATLAHEINNPLQAVANLVSLWRRFSGLDAANRGYAAMAEAELRRVTQLTQQSLTFYRESVSPTTVQIEETIEGILAIYYKRIKAKMIQVEKDFPAEALSIRSHAGEIRQIFTTVLLNAIEAVDAGGSITVRVRRSSRGNGVNNRGARITICDNGAGIPAANIARIFDPFFTTKGENGTGLGLWVASGIVDRLGGSIKVRSEAHADKHGTCFSIFLPSQPPKRN